MKVVFDVMISQACLCKYKDQYLCMKAKPNLQTVTRVRMPQEIHEHCIPSQFI